MMPFDLDWQDFIERLAVWQQLPVKARRAFTELRPNQGIPKTKLDGQEPLLVESGYVEMNPKGSRIWLAKPWHHFSHAILAIASHDIMARSDADAMLYYLRGHFTRDELSGMAQHLRYGYGYGVERLLVPEVMSVEWVEAFLAKNLIAKRSTRLERGEMPGWLTLHGPDRGPPVDPNVAKLLVRHLMELRGPVAFSEMPGRWADLPPRALGVAILHGIGQLVLFPTMQQKDMTPMLGLWPTICKRLHRPKQKPPKPIKPQTVFHGAFLVEDMTTMLVAAMTQPLRLRGNDAALFAKAEREIKADLMSVPLWVFQSLKRSSAGRIRLALAWLHILGLARRAGVAGDDLRIEATSKGERWLAESAKGRLKAIFDHLLSPTKVPRPSEHAAYAYGDDFDDLDDLEDDDFDEYNHYHQTLEFLPSELPVSNSNQYSKGLKTAVVSALTTLPGETFVPLAEFLGWQAREANPLPALFAKADGPKMFTGGLNRSASIEQMENLWSHFLMDMFSARLAPLGCVRLGMIEGSDNVCVALTGPGRYLLGTADDFDYGHDAQGQIVVQPNFEIVFLGPSPLAEASLARFAERKSRGVGSLFTITKKSILVAAGSGMTPALVLETLTRLSAKPLPANVTREITGWFDRCRRINVHAAILIHCPDADTAARVVAASGKKAVLLTDTVVELNDSHPHAKKELLRKLHGLGIFNQNHTSSGPRRHGG